jgi:hypothetical protein
MRAGLLMVSVSTAKRARREGITSRQVGRYDVTSALGSGAMGVVYRGHDPLLDRHVALKVMASSLASEPAVKARFEREAQAAARLAHANVVTVHDFGYHEGSPFVVMELLRGQDLRAALQRGTELTLERRLAIVLQVLAGLAHAHGAGVVHRDVKPANVFLTESGGVKVLDFGMARVTWAGSAGSDSVVGTFDYMSPEQVEGRRVDGRSDIFSVGSVLYELLVGEPPFRSESLVSTAYRIVHAQPDFERLPETEPCAALEPVLRKALAKDPAARYASAHEFASDLAARGGAPWSTSPIEAVVEEPADPAPAVEAEEETIGGAAAVAPAAAAPSRAQVWSAAIVLAAAGLVAYTVLRPAPVSAPGSSALASPYAVPSPARSTARSATPLRPGGSAGVAATPAAPPASPPLAAAAPTSEQAIPAASPVSVPLMVPAAGAAASIGAAH